LQVVHGTINARAFLWTIYTHICFADLIVTCESLRAFLKNTELMLRYPLQTTRWRQRWEAGRVFPCKICDEEKDHRRCKQKLSWKCCCQPEE